MHSCCPLMLITKPFQIVRSVLLSANNLDTPFRLEPEFSFFLFWYPTLSFLVRKNIIFPCEQLICLIFFSVSWVVLKKTIEYFKLDDKVIWCISAYLVWSGVYLVHICAFRKFTAWAVRCKLSFLNSSREMFLSSLTSTFPELLQTPRTLCDGCLYIIGGKKRT